MLVQHGQGPSIGAGRKVVSRRLFEGEQGQGQGQGQGREQDWGRRLGP